MGGASSQPRHAKRDSSPAAQANQAVVTESSEGGALDEVVVLENDQRIEPTTIKSCSETKKGCTNKATSKEDVFELYDAALAEKMVYEMMDEELALKLAAQEEGIHSSSPALQHHVDTKIQQRNDEEYAKKMQALFELEMSCNDLCRDEIQRIRDLSIRAEINSKANKEVKLLERARLEFQKQQQMEKEKENKNSEAILVPTKKREVEPISPTLYLNVHQQLFFRHYGFVVIQKAIPPDVISAAKVAANSLLALDVDTRIPLSPHVKLHANLPEGHRPEWIDCQDEKLRALFTCSRNTSLCRSIVGDFDFDSHKGAGSYSFAPRFRAWDLYPPHSNLSQKALPHALRTVCPSEAYDIHDLPAEFDSWSRQFLITSHGLGMTFAPCAFANWHVDGWDMMSIAGCDLLWKAFLTPLPRGNLGNVIVYPGSHYCISHLLRAKGARHSVWYNSSKGEKPCTPLPSLFSAGVADGRPYEVLVQDGDIILMHPFLAYGEGTNVSLSPHLATTCRLQSKQHELNRRCMYNKGGNLLEAHTWTGDIFSLQPGVA